MTDQSGEHDPIARALELMVYAPLGAALYLRDMGPGFLRMFVSRGRAEVDNRQDQVTTRIRHVKGAGEVAIAFGVPMVRKKVEQRLASLRPEPPAPPRATPGAPPQPAVATAAVGEEPVAEASLPAPVPAAGAPTGIAASNHESHAGNGHGTPEARLAIPGYDALSASQVVERLAGLSAEELAAVREYESGHRRRRTILGKIEQLTG